uniref:Uncharacterized protein n=1 Tax=Arundo donax TaxID=35708 RepID=A0A0A9HMN5_ARUDO
MDSSHTQRLHFNGNHKSISPEGTGSIIVNLHTARRRLDELCNYTGPTNLMDPLELAPSLGFWVVVIMEPKAREILDRHCRTVLGYVDMRLGNDWVKRVINNWSSASQQQLRSFDDPSYEPHDCGMPHLDYLDDMIKVFYYLHVDGYKCGLFYHAPMEPPPRQETWHHVDSGVGGGDIVVRKEPGPHNLGHITCKKRAPPKLEESLRNKKRKGLCGGGLGGPPDVPEVFTQWIWSDSNNQSCDDLINHLQGYGLEVLQSKRKPGPFLLKRLGDPEADKGDHKVAPREGSDNNKQSCPNLNVYLESMDINLQSKREPACRSHDQEGEDKDDGAPSEQADAKSKSALSDTQLKTLGDPEADNKGDHKVPPREGSDSNKQSCPNLNAYFEPMDLSLQSKREPASSFTRIARSRRG